MDIITALAVSISVLGAIATFAAFTIGHGIQIWAIFIAWGCFYHCGGKEAGLQKTIVHNIFGAVLAWVALLLVTQVLAAPLGLPLAGAVAVLITVFIAVIAAKSPMLSDIPATVFGYAPVFAYALSAGKLAVTQMDMVENPFVSVAVSLIIGALFGYVSEKLAGAIVKK